MKKFRKIVCIVAIVIVASFICTACGRTYQEATNQDGIEEYDFGGGYFTVITEWSELGANYRIAYANDTKVKYFITTSDYKFGITPLYNADGTLQVYKE